MSEQKSSPNQSPLKSAELEIAASSSASGDPNVSLDTLLSRISVAGAAIAGIIGAIWPDLGAAGQSISYGTAIILAIMGAILKYRKRKKGIPDRQADVVPSPTALLRGLLPFEDGDRLLGRRGDVQAVMTIIRSTGFRFGVIWGPSGCGKTSLLRAGLHSALREINVCPIYLPRPTADPVSLIQRQLDESVYAASLSGARSAAGQTTLRCVVMIDQFEEIFLLNQDRLSLEPLKRFLQNLLGNDRVAVLVGIREDFFARLQHLAPQVPDPTSTHSSYELQNLRVESAKEILAASVTSDGSVFSVELIEGVIADLDFEGMIRPTELQLVATHLKRRGVDTLDKYESLGRAKGILGSYIKDEIRRSGHEELARLLLRMMCADDFLTRLPRAQSLTELANALARQGIIASHEATKNVLSHLVVGRIVVLVEGSGYILIHDYFAPLIAAATQGQEGKPEVANRLLRRYAAQYRQDHSTRIPLREMLIIHRHASLALRGAPGIRELWIASWRSSILRLLAPVGILVFFPAGLAYAVLYSSYYLSTEPGKNKDSDPVIVVRSGTPPLKILPGFDRVVVGTDFSMGDLDKRDQMSRDAFPREVLTGLWFKRRNGYASWAEEINDRLTPLTKAESYRLLGQQERSRNILVSMLNQENQASVRVALQLGALGRLNPTSLSDSFLHPIVNLSGSDSKFSERVRVLAATALAQLAADGVSVSQASLPSAKSLLQMTRSAMKERSDDSGVHPAWAARPYFQCLISGSIAHPRSLSDEDIASALLIFADESLDTFARRDFVSVLLVLGSTSEEAAGKVVRGLLSTIYSSQYQQERREHGSGWLDQAAMEVVVELADRYPKAIDREVLLSLSQSLGNEEGQSYGNVIYYSAIVKSQPSALDPSVARKIFMDFKAGGMDQNEQHALAIAVTRLSLIDKQWSDSSARSTTWKILSSKVDWPSSSFRWAAAAVLLEVVEASPPGIDREKQIQVLTDESIDTFTNEGNEGVLTLVELLARATRLSGKAITNTGIKRLVETTIKSNTVGRQTEAAESLLVVANVAPVAINEASEQLAEAETGIPGSFGYEDFRYLAEAATARALYKEISSGGREGLLDKLLAKLQADADRDVRMSGAYGLFLLSLENRGKLQEVRDKLVEIAQSHQPHKRMAANRTLEMLLLSKIIHDGKTDRRLMPLTKSRLEQIVEDESVHMRVAARLILEDLSDL